MGELTCDLCGEPITDEQAEAGDYYDYSSGEYHAHCVNDALDDADGRRADYYQERDHDRYPSDR
jgi:hypothetical protein